MHIASAEHQMHYLTKAELFTNNFIAQGKSSHSRGFTVDVAIINATSGEELNMGTAIDFFGEESNTDSIKIPQEAQNNRKLLKNLMERYGFENIPSEWWHYTLKNEPFLEQYFDFDVK